MKWNLDGSLCWMDPQTCVAWIRLIHCEKRAIHDYLYRLWLGYCSIEKSLASGQQRVHKYRKILVLIYILVYISRYSIYLYSGVKSILAFSRSNKISYVRMEKQIWIYKSEIYFSVKYLFIVWRILRHRFPRSAIWCLKLTAGIKTSLETFMYHN